MGRLRAVGIILGFLILTLPLIPLQLLFLKILPSAARKLPQWYHRNVCRLLGLRLKIEGSLTSVSSLLLISNHTSWLDIPVLSTIAPLSFVSKEEVKSWPFVSILAKLQRSLFINRLRRADTRKKANEIFSRLSEGDVLVLFGEGTSTDGNRVLPFKSSLFASVLPSTPSSLINNSRVDYVSVQMVSIVYTSLHGVPLGRADRSDVGWFGDMEFLTHAWEVLKRGPLDAVVSIGIPVALEKFLDRKSLAKHAEQAIHKEVVRLLRGYSPDKDFAVADPPHGKTKTFAPRRASKKWQ